MSGDEIHRAALKISGLYRDVTTERIASTLPRKLGNGKTPVDISEERLQSILATLEECRAALVDYGSRETALLVSVAILELRMKLNGVADSELKALCDALLPDVAVATGKSPAQSRRPLLKLVK
jgi:hypothetical protein